MASNTAHNETSADKKIPKSIESTKKDTILKKKNGSSCNMLSSIFILLSIISAIGIASYQSDNLPELKLDHLLDDKLKWSSLRELIGLSTQTQAIDVPVPKYESEIVHMIPQVLLTPMHCAYEPQVVGDIMYISDVMNTTEVMRENRVVFLLLNGKNEGIHLTWQSDYSSDPSYDANSCLYALAYRAALVLGADINWMGNGLRFMTQMGDPITDTKGLDEDAGRIVHVLLDL